MDIEFELYSAPLKSELIDELAALVASERSE